MKNVSLAAVGTAPAQAIPVVLSFSKVEKTLGLQWGNHERQCNSGPCAKYIKDQYVYVRHNLCLIYRI
jgi:hypothetical protein